MAQPADRLVLRAGDEADCRAIEKDRGAVMPSAPAILRDAPNVLGASEWRAIDDQYSPGQAAVEHKKNRLGSGRMSEYGHCVKCPAAGLEDPARHELRQAGAARRRRRTEEYYGNT